MIDTNDSLIVRVPNIAGYRVLRRIDTGGQAAVYAAETDATGRLVAVKVLHDPAAAKRLEREARFLSALRHPGIVSILDAGRDGDNVYLVTDFIEGIPIDDYINLEGCGVDEVVDLLIAACEAVSFAHASGILHRDIKPANMLVAEGRRCYIVDFGLAAEDDTGRNSNSSSGSIVGTVDYCPPERLRGTPADFRGDVYALGIVLYECLADNLPYSGETRFDRARAVVYDEPTRLLRAAAGDRLNERLGPQFISPDLEAVVMKAIAKEPERRYPTVDALAADLRRCRAGEPVEARYGQRGYLARRLLARHRAAVATVGVMVVTLAVGFAWATYSWRRAERAVVQTQAAFRMAELQYASDALSGGASNAAIENLYTALRIAEELDAPSPKVLLQQYNIHYRLAQIFFDRKEDDLALRHAQSVIELAPSVVQSGAGHSQLASSQVMYGEIAKQSKRYAESGTAFLAAAAEYERIAADPPDDYPYMAKVAECRSRAGYALVSACRADDALDQYRAAVEIYTQLVSRHPENSSFAFWLSETENRVAAWHLNRKADGDARTALDLIARATERLTNVDDAVGTPYIERLRKQLEHNRATAIQIVTP